MFSGNLNNGTSNRNRNVSSRMFIVAGKSKTLALAKTVGCPSCVGREIEGSGTN
jgi:hypothetical protein